MLLIGKIKIAENRKINSYSWCPEQDSNLHASQHSHLKRARLPFRHLGFCIANVVIIFYSGKFIWSFVFGGREGDRLGGADGVSLIVE